MLQIEIRFKSFITTRHQDTKLNANDTFERRNTDTNTNTENKNEIIDPE